MAGACIIIFRAERLDESTMDLLKIYQKYVIEDTCGFSIESDFHMRPTYTDYEKEQLSEVFDTSSVQDICIFGECDRIFVVAYEIIKRFGGLLKVNIGASRKEINSHDGIKIEIHKKKWRNPLRHRPDYWLVDHLFIREFFAKVSGDNFEKFKLDVFIHYP
jgi:hypothetical protein